MIVGTDSQTRQTVFAASNPRL
ncbi:hypothetical protein ARTHRO9AX_130034 [Arthrobacter sp. 9AX]|nr:hypothetical protein ARTHRO9AX_130034 [Arthrobacter sp. 9AX]